LINADVASVRSQIVELGPGREEELAALVAAVAHHDNPRTVR
jgi:hypothetical protein